MKFYRYVLEDITNVKYFTDVRIKLTIWDLVRETPKGYWITDEYKIYNKWVPKESKARFAYPTAVEAIISFKKRTEKRLKIAQHIVDCCNLALRDYNDNKFDKA
jgi:hypothetical protein